MKYCSSLCNTISFGKKAKGPLGHSEGTVIEMKKQNKRLGNILPEVEKLLVHQEKQIGIDQLEFE
jgi:hypothetical protein